MKHLIARALRGRTRAQLFSLKLATYPRFDDWARANAGLDTVTGGQREKRNRLFELVAAEAGLLGRAIRYFEFGVHRGESILWWADHNADPDSRFYGFDSFEGLPEDWISDRGAGFFSTDGKTPQTDDKRVEFVAGWFHHTLPGKLDLLDTEDQRVFHMDADLYRSTIYPLLVMGPHLRAGDIMIFDEFHDSVHEFRAFEDFRAIFGIEADLIGATNGFVQAAFRLR